MAVIHHITGFSSFHMAARYMSNNLIMNMVQEGADNNNTNSKNRRTPLHEAVKVNRLHTVRHLIELGANLEIEAEEGTPLCVSIFKTDHLMVKELIEKGADVNHVVGGWTPLHAAHIVERSI